MGYLEEYMKKLFKIFIALIAVMHMKTVYDISFDTRNDIILVNYINPLDSKFVPKDLIIPEVKFTNCKSE